MIFERFFIFYSEASAFHFFFLAQFLAECIPLREINVFPRLSTHMKVHVFYYAPKVTKHPYSFWEPNEKFAKMTPENGGIFNCVYRIFLTSHSMIYLVFLYFSSRFALSPTRVSNFSGYSYGSLRGLRICMSKSLGGKKKTSKKSKKNRFFVYFVQMIDAYEKKIPSF
jgi:hypothetical protein